MSGNGTLAAPAQPAWTYIFTPRPQYWITFGEYAQGPVLDVRRSATLRR
jgi:rhizosphere induced protein